MSTPAGLMDNGAAYRLVRQRVDASLRGADAETAELTVPSCPDWTVREALSHLVGVCSDVLAGRADAAGSAPWTAAQVAARRGRPVVALLDEWARTSEQVISLLTGRSALGQMVMDAVSHEYDLRAAVGAPVPPDDPVLDVALGWLARAFGRRLDAGGVPSLRLVSDGVERTLGSGKPAATVQAGRFDAVRMLTGRRTLAQVAALDWDGDPAPWLDALTWGPFVPPSVDREPT